VGVVVFDADVLIGYLQRNDPHHGDAVERVERSLALGTRRFLSAVNYAELLVGPLRQAGRRGVQTVDEMLVGFWFETVQIDMDLARRAAAVRAGMNLKIPDAFVVATAIHAEQRGFDDVRIESFDETVLKAYASRGPAT
jgi:predicted nucleic acid-binding protein